MISSCQAAFILKYVAGGELIMTETYHGPWNLVTGDKPQRKVTDDPYHTRYPDATETQVQYNQPAQSQQPVVQDK